MDHSKNWRVGLAALLSAGSLVGSGCSDASEASDDEATASAENVETMSDALHRRWRPHPPTSGAGGTSPGTGGTAPGGGGTLATGGTTPSGGTPAASCSLCATTQACCNAVNAGPLCTFSANTCASLDPGRQATYSRNCLMVLRTTISAWKINGRTPPSACTLPQ